MATRRRSPAQTLFTVALLLVGIWIGIAVVRNQFMGRASMEEIHHRPQLHLVDASPQDLVDSGFSETALALPWADISLRLYQDASGDFVRVLKCTIPPAGVAQLLELEPGARRPPAGGPPPWWPWDREGDDTEFRVPTWFTPQGAEDLIVERYIPGEEAFWQGMYVSYEREAQRLWLWQWRRSAQRWQPPGLEETAIEPIDALAQGFGAHLIALRHPPTDDGWLLRPDQDLSRSGVPRSVLPPAVSRVDLCLRPSGQRSGGGHDYLMALHGVRRQDLPLLLRDHYLRPLSDDSPPPLAAWDFARPAEPPLWFAAEDGPRWATSLRFPGSEEVASGRWVAYEPERQRLLIWDWARPDAGAPLSADLVTGQALPKWPDGPWQLPSLP